MIKVKVLKENDFYKEIIITGHANYDSYGKDIVCSSVSSIVVTTVNAIISLDKDVSLELIRSMCENFYGMRVSYTYDKYNLLNETDSIADAPKDIFNYLLKYRIKYDSKEHNEYLKWLNDK